MNAVKLILLCLEYVLAAPIWRIVLALHCVAMNAFAGEKPSKHKAEVIVGIAEAAPLNVALVETKSLKSLIQDLKGEGRRARFVNVAPGEYFIEGRLNSIDCEHPTCVTWDVVEIKPGLNKFSIKFHADKLVRLGIDVSGIDGLDRAVFAYISGIPGNRNRYRYLGGFSWPTENGDKGVYAVPYLPEGVFHFEIYTSGMKEMLGSGDFRITKADFDAGKKDILIRPIPKE